MGNPRHVMPSEMQNSPCLISRMTSHSELDSLKIFNQKAMKFNSLYFNELEKIKKISIFIYMEEIPALETHTEGLRGILQKKKFCHMGVHKV